MSKEPQTTKFPVQDAEPVTGNAEVQGTQVGRTGGANPPTGATSQTTTAPRSESIKQTKTDEFFLTHSIWHNGYGACPETGVRSVVNGEIQEDFRLIQHGVRDFAFAEHYILKGLRKGWGASRICDFVEHLFERKRPKAVLL